MRADRLCRRLPCDQPYLIQSSVNTDHFLRPSVSTETLEWPACPRNCSVFGSCTESSYNNLLYSFGIIARALRLALVVFAIGNCRSELTRWLMSFREYRRRVATKCLAIFQQNNTVNINTVWVRLSPSKYAEAFDSLLRRNFKDMEQKGAV